MAFFYSLSGFLIVRIYYQRVELKAAWLSKYFVNRFARIYPVYFLLLSIAIFLLIRENTFLSRLLSKDFAGLLGRSSYSFYLVHTLVIDYVSIPYLLPIVGHRIRAAVSNFMHIR
jgi:peptidoglycan/LPS O-acetylase OafA/YrhL